MLKVLYSGSSGNCIFIEYNNVNYIIDIGVSYKQITDKISSDLLSNKSNVFITHTHQDHIKGLKMFDKKQDCSIYGSEEVLKYCDNLNIIEDDSLVVDEAKIDVIELSHDVKSTYGYVIHLGKYKIVVITDTGYISNENITKVMNPDILLLESNHDVDMLMSGSYRWPLKKRVIGDYGHLSNDQFNSYVSRIKGDNTRYIVALHLSEENNDIELVKNRVKEIDNCVCYVASRNGVSETIHFDWK